MSYLRSRFQEKSTWSVIGTLILGTLGLNLAPDSANAIIGGVIALLSAIGIITPEKKER